MGARMWKRTQWWWRRRQEDKELDEEIQSHLEIEARERANAGASPSEAEAAARRAFGNRTQIAERTREVWGLRWMEELGRDLRYGARSLRRTPGFTFVSVLTLALGIGANTAIFSVVKNVLLEPLAYTEPGRIVAVQTLWTKTNHAGNVSGGDYADLVAQPSPFAAATRYSGGEMPVETAGQAEFVAAYGTDAGFADVFQLRPVAGRLITPSEFKTKANVAVVSEDFALRHFGEANRALGQTLRLEDNALAIVGVLPAEFHFPL